MYKMKNKTEKVQKRDGSIVDFDSERIASVVFKALTATNEGNGNRTKKLVEKIVKILNLRFKEGVILHVEQIQDIVEEVLLSSPYRRTAKSYIIYRDQHARLREITNKM